MADDQILGDVNDPNITIAPAESSQPQQSFPQTDGAILGDVNSPGVESLEEHDNSFGQQALATGEGVAQGVLGPIAPAAEIATGLTSGADILQRQYNHPWLHGIGEGVGFAGSAVFGDELGLSGVAGELGEAAARALPEVAGAKTAAELATLTASNELSKMVEGDPNQTLGSAAINVGLSGLIGGLGGPLLGKLNPIASFAKPAVKNTGADVATFLVKEAIAAIGGAVIASGVGLPMLPALLLGGVIERPLAWMAEPLVRSFIGKLVDTDAADAAAEYIYTAQKGNQTLTNTISNLFSEATKPQTFRDLFPSQASRDKLENAIEVAGNPSNAIDSGSKVYHYLPDHTTAMAQTTAQAVNYFNSLKPTQPTLSPLDQPPPVDRAQQATYNRALDVAQQPLVVLAHIKNGSLQPQDMTTLRTIYPGLHDQMIKKITEQVIQNKAAVQAMPYAQRDSLNTLMGGAPIDSTMSPMAAQAIIQSASPQQQAQAQQTKTGRQPGKASGKELDQINKVSALYQTPSEVRQIDKRS